MEGCISTRGGRIRFRSIVPFHGDVSVLSAGDYVVVGWGRGLSWPDYMYVDRLVSMSPYSGFLRIDRRFLRIRAGTRVASILRFLVRRRLWMDITYPWDPMESVGGLMAQGFNPLPGSSIHVYGDEGHVITEEYKDGLILDVRVEGLSKGEAGIIYLLVSRGEAGLLYNQLVEAGIPFSIVRGDTGYFIVIPIASAADRRRVVKALSILVDKNRISIWDGGMDRLPSISDKYLVSGVRIVDSVEVSRDYVPNNLVFYSWPMGLGLLGGMDEEG